MRPDEIDEIIGQMTEATVHLVHANLDLVRRIATDAGAEGGRGPAEEAWLAWTDSAGDVVQLSYLAAQMVDGLLGRRPPTPPD